MSITGAESLEISRTLNFQKNKIYRIPYRTRQTGANKESSTCHLTSDWGYFEFSYEKKESESLPVCNISLIPYCKEVSESSCTCEKCYDEKIDGYEYIIGNLSIDKEANECICDVENGFKRYPKEFPKEFSKYLSIILRFVFMNFPFKNEKAFPSWV